MKILVQLLTNENPCTIVNHLKPHHLLLKCYHLPRLVSPALPLTVASCKLLVITGDSCVAPNNRLRASCRLAAFRSMLFTITDYKGKSHDESHDHVASNTATRNCVTGSLCGRQLHPCPHAMFVYLALDGNCVQFCFPRGT